MHKVARPRGKRKPETPPEAPAEPLRGDPEALARYRQEAIQRQQAEAEAVAGQVRRARKASPRHPDAPSVTAFDDSGTSPVAGNLYDGYCFLPSEPPRLPEALLPSPACDLGRELFRLGSPVDRALRWAAAVLAVDGHHPGEWLGVWGDTDGKPVGADCPALCHLAVTILQDVDTLDQSLRDPAHPFDEWIPDRERERYARRLADSIGLNGKDLEIAIRSGRPARVGKTKIQSGENLAKERNGDVSEDYRGLADKVIAALPRYKNKTQAIRALSAEEDAPSESKLYRALRRFPQGSATPK